MNFATKQLCLVTIFCAFVQVRLKPASTPSSGEVKYESLNSVKIWGYVLKAGAQSHYET